MIFKPISQVSDPEPSGPSCCKINMLFFSRLQGRFWFRDFDLFSVLINYSAKMKHLFRWAIVLLQIHGGGGVFQVVKMMGKWMSSPYKIRGERMSGEMIVHIHVTWYVSLTLSILKMGSLEKCLACQLQMWYYLIIIFTRVSSNIYWHNKWYLF